MKMRSFIAGLFLLFCTGSLLFAGEGMWLPLLLQQLNEAEMQSMGMKMSAEDIYSVNEGSLKDAIVRFGRGCTGEVISEQGLILTNFHCGRGQINSHATLENNIYENGFWAKSKTEEIPNPGLTVTFIVRMEDVTEKVLMGVEETMAPRARQSQVDKNLSKVRAEVQKESYQQVEIRPFYNGNQYYLFITEVYSDIRLVGNPPAAIGEFGKDTDNWVWPRHSGDFSLFRIYAGPDNKPASYSPDNVPFKPRHSLPISLDGIDEGDFTLVFGFPGRTDEYLPAVAMEQRVNVLNPTRIGIRQKALTVMNSAMQADPEVKIQYTSKQARIANAWKKWIGESQGVLSTGGIEKKQAFEKEFQKRVDANPEWKKKYGDILPQFEQLYKELEPLAKTRALVGEIGGVNVELFRLVGTLSRYEGRVNNDQGRKRLTNYLEGFYKSYRPEIDQKIFAAAMESYFNELPKEHLSPFAIEQINSVQKDYNKLAKMVFQKSVLTRTDGMLAAIRTNPEKAAMIFPEDYAYKLIREILIHNNKVVEPYNGIKEKIDELQRKYMQALLEVFPEKRFYPDANSTLRVTYGKAEGFKPRDAVSYDHITYLEGIMEKYKPEDYEFDVPEKLRSLAAKKDYGQYAEDGRMPVCFIGTNHTSGGNSGSPAIDAYGNLVGLNFDRVWEGTMSDINYDPSICRNIMVDIRYVLFIVDKFGGATNIIEELELVHPK